MKKLIILFLLLGLSLPAYAGDDRVNQPLLGSQVDWGHNLTDGLVGWWMMNEGSGDKVYDLSGYGNNGTLTNMAPASDWVGGRDGYALDFDGDNDHIVVGTMNELDVPITIMAWVLPTAGNSGTIFGRNYSNGGYRYENLFRVIGTAKLSLLDDDGPNSYSVISTGTVNTGEWNHIAVTKAKNNDVVFYINGNNAGSGNAGGDFDATGYNYQIGEINTGHYPFDGSISEVRIYNRALSADEIKELYYDSYAMFHDPWNRLAVAAAPTGAEQVIMIRID